MSSPPKERSNTQEEGEQQARWLPLVTTWGTAGIPAPASHTSALQHRLQRSVAVPSDLKGDRFQRPRHNSPKEPGSPLPQPRYGSWGSLHQHSSLGTRQGCPAVLPAARHVVNSACCQQLPAARRWRATKGAFAVVRDTRAKPGGGGHQVTVPSPRRLLANAKSLHKKGQKSLSGKAGMNLL